MGCYIVHSFAELVIAVLFHIYMYSFDVACVYHVMDIAVY